jgi:hypothetical protein
VISCRSDTFLTNDSTCFQLVLPPGAGFSVVQMRIPPSASGAVTEVVACVCIVLP